MSLIKLASTIALALLCLQPAANAQSLPTRETPAPAAARKAAMAAKERINAWTVGLAGGLIEGAPLRLAAEIARVVDEEDKLHVIPIVTRGATENVNSLLYLKGSTPRSSIRMPLTSTRPRSRSSNGASSMFSTCFHPNCTSSSAPRSSRSRSSTERRSI